MLLWFKEKKIKHTGIFFKGNYVYSCAMNLAWQELKSILNSDSVLINTNDKLAINMVSLLNDGTFLSTDLDKKSYYIKSGTGTKTVDIINTELNIFFPNKTITPLNIELSDQNILCYAYFLKKITYLTPFKKEDIFFEGKKVSGFKASSNEELENIHIINYKDDDNFIISLKLKEKTDEMIICKNTNIKDPNTIIKDLSTLNTNKTTNLNGNDCFYMPNIKFNLTRDYKDLENKTIANKGFENLVISRMFENIAFELDNIGAKVENDATIILYTGSPKITKQRLFILDRPFWIVMRKKGSNKPYFILWVKNEKIMTLV